MNHSDYTMEFLLLRLEAARNAMSYIQKKRERRSSPKWIKFLRWLGVEVTKI